MEGMKIRHLHQTAELLGFGGNMNYQDFEVNNMIQIDVYIILFNKLSSS